MSNQLPAGTFFEQLLIQILGGALATALVYMVSKAQIKPFAEMRRQLRLQTGWTLASPADPPGPILRRPVIPFVVICVIAGLVLTLSGLFELMPSASNYDVVNERYTVECKSWGFLVQFGRDWLEQGDWFRVEFGKSYLDSGVVARGLFTRTVATSLVLLLLSRIWKTRLAPWRGLSYVTLIWVFLTAFEHLVSWIIFRPLYPLIIVAVFYVSKSKISIVPTFLSVYSILLARYKTILALVVFQLLAFPLGAAVGIGIVSRLSPSYRLLVHGLPDVIDKDVGAGPLTVIAGLVVGTTFLDICRLLVAGAFFSVLEERPTGTHNSKFMLRPRKRLRTVLCTRSN